VSKDGIEVKLTGTLDVIHAFEEFRKELPKNPMRKAVRAAADILTRAISAVTPVRTGRLLGNIRTSVSTAKGVTRGRVVINNAAFYWRFLELGWRTKSGGFHRFPFATPAIHAHEQEAAQKVIDECEAQVRKVQQKILKQTAGSF
jgi:HK97 gp10 family phage protein